MNSPIEEQLRQYFTEVDRTQGQVDIPSPVPDSPHLSLEHDTNESNQEIIMLSPNRNAPPTPTRRWTLVAAAVAAVALVGGLIGIANRNSDDRVPADQPAPTVSVPDPPVDPAPETLPASGLPTRGVMSSTCEAGEFSEDRSIGTTAPQTCQLVGDPLPIASELESSLTLVPSDQTVGAPGPGQLFVSFNDDGFIGAGYTSVADNRLRSIAQQPGIGDFAGETVAQLTRDDGDGEGGLITDWSTDVDDAPLPTTDTDGISADVAVDCVSEFVGGDDTEQVLDQTCTYTSNDARFVTAPEVTRVRIVPADPADVTLRQGATFFTAQAQSGAATAGFSTDGIQILAVGFRPGTGEFEGQLIHDVMHLTADPSGNITGTIRSTVYPAD